MAKRTAPKNRYLVRMAKDGWFEDSSKNTYYPNLQKARSAIYSKLVKMHNEDYCGYIICNDKIINRVVWETDMESVFVPRNSILLPSLVNSIRMVL